MEKAEFIENMNVAIQSIKKGDRKYSCDAMQCVFAKHYPACVNKYLESIKHLFGPFNYSTQIDWDKLGILFADPEARIKFRIKLLKNFKEKCLKDKFYEEL